jgi:hypothetical protein
LQRLFELIRLRGTHPAFEGSLEVSTPDPSTLRMRRTHGGAVCELVVELPSGRMTIEG